MEVYSYRISFFSALWGQDDVRFGLGASLEVTVLLSIKFWEYGVDKYKLWLITCDK